MEDIFWDKVFFHLDYAYQPIIDSSKGGIFAYEALLRGYVEAGYSSIDELLNAAYEQGVLYELDLQLRKLAITKFMQFANDNEKLFYNIDSRILEMKNYQSGNTKNLLNSLGLSTDIIHYEISEKYHFKSYEQLRKVLQTYKMQGYHLALDDFGAGYSGIELLYHADISILKIDRFLVDKIHKDSKKRLFMGHIIKLAHTQGIKVVAEGVETIEEFYTCRDLGADYIQGYFVQKPTTIIADLGRHAVTNLINMLTTDRRNRQKDATLIEERLEKIEPLSKDIKISSIASKFKNDERVSIYPVVNTENIPLGLISERGLKKYFYSPYGKDVISNHIVESYMSNCPIIDISTPIETILDAFSDYADNTGGMIITKEGKYVGFLSPQALLAIINEKNLRAAREQNPLTKLPGNILISEYIANAIEDLAKNYMLIYFDLDNFKPFNDKFGFRQGDRAILLFSDILKELIYESSGFVGHIGGDDFFAAITTESENSAISLVESILYKFCDSARTFYSEEDKEKGYIRSKDRFGVEKDFPLLTASASCIFLKSGKRTATQEGLSGLLAELKKDAKSSALGYVIRYV